MKRIFVASAWRANTPEEAQKNLERAIAACRDVALAGHAPFAPHLFYTRFLDDNTETERAAGMAAGREFLSVCNELWVYGPESPGVRAEIAHAITLSIPVYRITI